MVNAKTVPYLYRKLSTNSFTILLPFLTTYTENSQVLVKKRYWFWVPAGRVACMLKFQRAAGLWSAAVDFSWVPCCNLWATVCKTVRPMLSDRCPVLSVCLSVTFVHCGQTVGRIKTKLGTQVGLVPGHIVLDGNQAPPPPRGKLL